MAKITLESIQEQLSKDNWKVISEEYKNLDEQMTFLCPEGHRVYNSWKKMRTKCECPICKDNIYTSSSISTKITPKKKGAYRVLAFDQATKVTGWSVYDDSVLVAYGAFEAGELGDLIDRIIEIKNWAISMIKNWNPDRVGIEGIQFEEKFGVTTFESLAELEGVLRVTCTELGIPHEVCHTAKWRKSLNVKGRSRADKKRSMQLIAKEKFDITVSDDIADAIGIGYYVSQQHPSDSFGDW